MNSFPTTFKEEYGKMGDAWRGQTLLSDLFKRALRSLGS